MIGYANRQSEFARAGDSIFGIDSAIDANQNPRPAPCGFFGGGGRDAVAFFAGGNPPRGFRAHLREGAGGERGRGHAVGVEIAANKNRFAGGDGVRQNPRAFASAGKRGGRRQSGERRSNLRAGRDAARRQSAGDERLDSVGLQIARGARAIIAHGERRRCKIGCAHLRRRQRGESECDPRPIRADANPNTGRMSA